MTRFIILYNYEAVGVIATDNPIDIPQVIKQVNWSRRIRGKEELPTDPDNYMTMREHSKSKAIDIIKRIFA